MAGIDSSVHAPQAAPATPWHTQPVESVRNALDTGIRGLSSEEAASRLERFGPNEVDAERPTPWWKLVLHQFRDPLVYILLIAATFTFALEHYTDTGVILAVVLLNAIIGFVQEMRARQAIIGLARLSAPRAEVIRDGRTLTMESRELVPGDLVALASGARVPADLRIESVRDLEVDESALTGESVPVRKTLAPLDRPTLVPGDQRNMAFAGTVVTRGRARGYVVRTGLATELGRIATRIREVGATATPLQLRMNRFGRQIGLVVLGLTLIVAIAGVLRGLSTSEVLTTAVALAVSAIPEGLPVVLTVTLAIGVSRMARRHAIIRSLPAVETLGSTTLIGSDKTGTLTRNEMTVRTVWTPAGEFTLTGAGYSPDGDILEGDRRVDPATLPALRFTLLAGLLANEADADAVEAGSPQGDPTEIALHVAAARGGLIPAMTRREHPELDVLPFEPERRFMASLNDSPDGERRILLKGAPEVVLQRCTVELGPHGTRPLDEDAAHTAVAELSGRGLRVLAMAWRETDGDRLDEHSLQSGFTFAGLQGMEDPVRDEAVAAVAAAHEAGIRVVMLTGDHVATARAIGRQLGLGNEQGDAIEGSELDGLSDEELDSIASRVDIYARVAPEHKLRLVQLFKERGETVAVTGDGVNDAPALRAAHLGIAMGRGGTDVAREASDMVLSDDNFATITAAIEEGRVIFSNIRKVTFFLLSTGVGQVLTILVALFAGFPLPFIAAQILWINLVTNGLQDVALAFEPGEPGLLRRPPRPASEGILTPRLLRRLGAVGVVLAAGTLATFWVTLSATGDLDYARSTAMTQMVVFQFFHVFNCRSLDRSVLRVPFFSNRFLFISIIAAAVAHALVLYLPVMQRIFRTQPVHAEHWLLIIGIASAVIVGGEIDKWWNRHKHRELG
jgi:magnesium-transporting ATPase (P-type)